MNIQFSSQITFKEYYRHSLYSIIKNPLIVFIFLATVVPGTYQLIMNGTNLEPYSYPLLFFIIYFISLPLILFLTSKRAFSTNPYLKELQHYEINEEFIHIRSVSGEHTIKWPAIHKIRETKHSLLVYTSNRTMLILPKKSLKEEDVEVLKGWADRYPGGQKKTKSILKTKLFYITLCLGLFVVFLIAFEVGMSGSDLRDKSFAEALFLGVYSVFGFILLAAILSGLIALIPRKDLTYLRRFLLTLCWVCLILFSFMSILLIMGIM